jgi:hypothetical protein
MTYINICLYLGNFRKKLRRRRNNIHLSHKGEGFNQRCPSLTNAKGWCPIDLRTFESIIHKNVHIIVYVSMVKICSDLDTQLTHRQKFE